MVLDLKATISLNGLQRGQDYIKRQHERIETVIGYVGVTFKASE